MEVVDETLGYLDSASQPAKETKKWLFGIGGSFLFILVVSSIVVLGLIPLYLLGNCKSYLASLILIKTYLIFYILSFNADLDGI